MKKFKKAELLRRWYINSSIGVSAVRNQGEGVIYPIRNILLDEFSTEEFIHRLRAKKASSYSRYLNTLTERIAGQKAYKEHGVNRDRIYTGCKVKWGTARKCINLVMRKVVYTGNVWEKYNITSRKFDSRSYLNRLELPLDSYAFDGIRNKCEKIGIEYKEGTFEKLAISTLQEDKSAYLQKLAAKISIKMNVCRVDLDLLFWRNDEDENDE